jgi:hypothetical protein
MSTYPGEDPQQPSGQQPDDQPGQDQPTQDQPGQDQPTGQTEGQPSAEAETEPTQPVGYWERQAADQARRQTQQGDPDPAAAGGAVFNPTTAQQTGWEQQPTTPYEQNPYAQPQQGQPAYGQPYPQQPYYAPPGYGPPPPPYAYPPGGQQGPPPGAHPGYPPYAFSPPRPNHPQSTLALILGICGLGGAVIACGLGLLVSPFAWALGRNALKEIQASHGQLGGESSARTGMVLGIIGTVLLILAVIGIVIFGVLVAVSDTSSGSNI